MNLFKKAIAVAAIPALAAAAFLAPAALQSSGSVATAANNHFTMRCTSGAGSCDKDSTFTPDVNASPRQWVYMLHNYGYGFDRAKARIMVDSDCVYRFHVSSTGAALSPLRKGLDGSWQSVIYDNSPAAVTLRLWCP